MQHSEAYTKLQKKLIIPNFLLVIVALIAAASLLLLTSLEIRVHVDGDTIAAAQNSAAAQAYTAETDGTDIADGSDVTDGTDGDTTEENGSESTESSQDETAFLLQNVDMTVKLRITPKEVLRAAFSSDERAAVKALLRSVIGGNEQVFDDLFAQIAPSTLALYAIRESGVQNPDYASLDTAGFTQAITLLNEQDPVAAKEAFLQASRTFSAEQLQTELTDEQIASLGTSFDDYVQMGTADGIFSTSNLLEASGQENPLAVLTATDELVDSMSDDTLSKVHIGVLAFGIFLLACAALWALLALLAFLHIFLPNKKVAMWYVKLTGGLPCLLLFVLPLVFSKLTGTFFTGQAAVLSDISFMSLTFVSGICYLAMWFISIFLCHPVKKRLKGIR